MVSLQFQRLGDLDVLTLQRPGASRAIVLLHGYGADFQDLAGLAEILDARQQWDWYFPNAPLPSPHSPTGRAWFPIAMDDLDQALRRGDPHPFAATTPAGLEAASDKLQSLLEELSSRYTALSVGGFSQGAMVSCDAVFHAATKPRSLLVLSGTYVAATRWQQALSQRAEHRCAVFQSHGRGDPILPYAAALELQNLFQKHAYPVAFHPFSGGHEIPWPVLEALRLHLEETQKADETGAR